MEAEGEWIRCRENERETETRGRKESRKRDRGRRVRLQFVLGSHSASVHSATGASNWIAEGQVGRGRGWGLKERREKGGEEWEEEGDGVQRMQRQSWKMGRLLTSHRKTDKVKRGG